MKVENNVQPNIYGNEYGGDRNLNPKEFNVTDKGDSDKKVLMTGVMGLKWQGCL